MPDYWKELINEEKKRRSATKAQSTTKKNQSPQEESEPVVETPADERVVNVKIVNPNKNRIGLAISIITMILFALLVYGAYRGMENQEGGIMGAFGREFTFIKDVTTRFTDVKGCDEAKEELYDLVSYLRNPTYFEDNNIKVPRGVLLIGPPGTGKTHMARALAGEAGVPFISTSGSEFDEMFVGVGSRRIRNLFKKARENAPCIIFIDEIDAVAGSRDNRLNNSGQTLNQLLVELDGFGKNTGVVVLAATNLAKQLDPAITRTGRFDRKVVIDLPEMKARQEMLELYAMNRAASNVDFEVLARSTAGFSGSDLESMVNWAALEASKRQEPDIPMGYFENAILSISLGRERKSMVLSEETRRLCAYHEAGHAIVALKTPGGPKIRRATLTPRGSALGLVNFLAKDENPLITQQELKARMDSCMGGRAAEEIIFGADFVTQGAGSDFQNATATAKNMVMQLGMSPKIGPTSLDPDKISSATQHVVDSEVMRLCNESMSRAKKVLQSHRTQLDNLAKALLTYEILTEGEILRVMEGETLETLESKPNPPYERQAEFSLSHEERKQSILSRQLALEGAEDEVVGEDAEARQVANYFKDGKPNKEEIQHLIDDAKTMLEVNSRRVERLDGPEKERVAKLSEELEHRIQNAEYLLQKSEEISNELKNTPYVGTSVPFSPISIKIKQSDEPPMPQPGQATAIPIQAQELPAEAPVSSRAIRVKSRREKPKHERLMARKAEVEEETPSANETDTDNSEPISNASQEATTNL